MGTRKALIIIPARKGSSLKDKHLRQVRGSSLIDRAIKSASIDHPYDILVSSDSDEILAIGKKAGCWTHKRPSNLADAKSTLTDVVKYLVKKYAGYLFYVVLQPDSPFRNVDHVNQAINKFLKLKATSLVSVVAERHSIWKEHEDGCLSPVNFVLSNRQDTRPLYISNGAIFITKDGTIGGKPVAYPMSWQESIEIHTLFDLKLAEALA